MKNLIFMLLLVLGCASLAVQADEVLFNEVHNLLGADEGRIPGSPANQALEEKTAARFKAEFFIYKDGMEINGKSIIGVMTLAAEQGSRLLLRFRGPDEAEAARAVTELFDRGFDE